jgi:hypothetical protein
MKDKQPAISAGKKKATGFGAEKRQKRGVDCLMTALSNCGWAFVFNNGGIPPVGVGNRRNRRNRAGSEEEPARLEPERTQFEGESHKKRGNLTTDLSADDADQEKADQETNRIRNAAQAAEE